MARDLVVGALEVRLLGPADVGRKRAARRVRAVARDRGDPHPSHPEHRAPVTQEPQLVSSGAGPVVEVEREEQRPLRGELREPDSADVVVEDGDVGNTVAGLEHAAETSYAAGTSA